MTGRVRRGAALLAAFVVLSGCANPSSDPPSPADTGPDRPAAGGGMLEVDALPLNAPVVLDPIPQAYSVQSSTYNEGYEYEIKRSTLYGDPSLTDTLDGPVLLAGSSSGDATIGGPPRDTPGERRLDVGGIPGWLVHVGDRTWVGIGADEGRVDFLLARGVNDEDMITAANAADFSTDIATVATAGVPAGLQPLIVGAPSDGPYTFATGERVRFDGDASVYVSAVRADPRLSALWGFWADDPGGSMVGGQPGSSGDMDGILFGSGARGRVWAENGMVLSVFGYGASDALLDQVVAGLRQGTAAEFDAMRLGRVESEPSAEDVGCQPGTPIASAVEGPLRWAFGLEYGPGGGMQTCLVLIGADQPSGPAGGAFIPGPLGQVSGTSFLFGGAPNAGTIVGGLAPPGTARVVIVAADAVPRDAVLLDSALRPGERLYGQFFTSPGPYLVTALDATGVSLGTLQI